MGIDPGHPTFVCDRILHLNGVYRHDLDVWEPTGEMFDEWTVVVSDHVENRQVNRVLGGEGIGNVNGIQHGQVPNDESSEAREVDIGVENPLRTGSVQCELAQLSVP